MKQWDVYVNGSNVGSVESTNYKTARRSAIEKYKPENDDRVSIDLSTQKIPMRSLGLASNSHA
jgi:hypothetical protein